MGFASIPTVTFNNVQVSIHVIDQEVYSDLQPEYGEQLPIHNEVSVLQEQTQQAQKPIPLRWYARQKRSAIPDEFVVFLLEHEENNRMMEDDLANFH